MDLPQHYPSLLPSQRREVRHAYQVSQGGMCAHCGADLSDAPSDDIASLPIKKRLFPKRFFDWPIHLHHCHKTGMTIGAVHAKCNAVLWQYFGE